MSLRWLAAPEGNVSVLTVSLFGYSYPLVAPHLRPDDSLLPFASLEDITSMKLAAITSRGSRKDVIDLWMLVTRHWSLSECLEFFEKIRDPRYRPRGSKSDLLRRRRR